MSNENRMVTIGQVGPTFGNKGEVKVRPLIDDPEEFRRLKKVSVVGGPPEVESLTITGVRFHHDLLIVKFAGIDGMTAAESLRNAELQVEEFALPPLGENEYYIDDLIGMEVVTNKGRDLGRIREVLRSPANDVYVTDRAMIPAVKEIVLSIDLQAKKMTVDDIEGLMQEEQTNAD